MSPCRALIGDLLRNTANNSIREIVLKTGRSRARSSSAGPNPKTRVRLYPALGHEPRVTISAH